jgi:hypothetical protein
MAAPTKADVSAHRREQDNELSGQRFQPVRLCLLVDRFDVQAQGYVAPAVVQDFKIPNAAL